MEIRPITECRLCRSPNLELALKLADIPLADGYSGAPSTTLYPDELQLCMNCGHAQMGHMLNPEIMFTEYLFHSGDNPALVKHLQMQGDYIMQRFDPMSVLEIGSNDGTLLAHMAARCNVYGVDPAKIENKVETLKQFFTAKLAKDLGKWDCVIANHVFAHADDLGDMLEGIRTCLAPNGVFVFENAYLLDLVNGCYYDQIYHEHPSYHAVGPLMEFFEAHGMELFDVGTNPCKGGSVRGFVQHRGGPHAVNHDHIGNLLYDEFNEGVSLLTTYERLAKRIEAQKWALPKGKLVGYGASSSCTPVIYNLELQDRLAYLVDDNPRKHGLYSPGAGIPVKHPEELKGESLPVVVLALRYAEQIGRKLNGKAVVLP